MRNWISKKLSTQGLSTRALIFGIVLFILAITLAPPLQHYLNQRAQINSLRTQLSDSQKMLANAQAELSRWNDPNYVANQARARLHFIFPGERSYVIIGPEQTNDPNQSTKISNSFPIGIPWYQRIIASITSTNP